MVELFCAILVLSNKAVLKILYILAMNRGKLWYKYNGDIKSIRSKSFRRVKFSG